LGSVMQVKVGMIQVHTKIRKIIIDLKVDGFIWLHVYDKLIHDLVNVRSEAALV
jgi:hypothetical protein